MTGAIGYHGVIMYLPFRQMPVQKIENPPFLLVFRVSRKTLWPCFMTQFSFRKLFPDFSGKDTLTMFYDTIILASVQGKMLYCLNKTDSLPTGKAYCGEYLNGCSRSALTEALPENLDIQHSTTIWKAWERR